MNTWNVLERLGNLWKSEPQKPQKHGYSIFFTLSDNTQLELVLEVDGDLKRVHQIQLGEAKKAYEGKLEWIRALDGGKIKRLKSLEL